MELTTSRESLRINVIAIYVLLPNFPHDMVAKHFTDIGNRTFSQLDNQMYMKITNSSHGFHSTTKRAEDNCTFPYGGSGALQQKGKNARLGIQYAEKMSQRLDALKHDDPVLDQDPVKVFNDGLQKLQQNLGLPNLEPLL